MTHDKQKFHLIAVSFILLVITAAAFFAAVETSSSSTRALNILDPVIIPLATWFRFLPGYGYPYFMYLAIFTIISLFLTSFGLKNKTSRALCYAGIFGVAGQLFLVDRELCFRVSHVLGWLTSPHFFANSTEDRRVALLFGLLLYLLAALVFICANRAAKKTDNHEDIPLNLGVEAEHRVFGIKEAIVLTAIFMVALIFRTYALNLLLDNFEGELSPYSAGATSLQGMFYANKGTHGPWAPLGILYYLPIYVTTKLFGTSLLALRLSSALVGVFTIPLVYLLANRIGGKVCATVAIMLFALNCLHIGWSRTDVHPHGVTTWPTLLMCWCLIKAFDTRRLGWAAAVALMMGLSWHQYPSGQSAVAIPLIAMGMYWISNRLKLPLTLTQTAIVSLGVILWAIGLPLSYYFADGVFSINNPFTLTGPRAMWSGENLPPSRFEVARIVIAAALRQLGDVFQGIFYRQPYLFHQEWVASADFVYIRTVPWLQAPFVVLGGLLLWNSRKRFESIVIFAWIIAAILPGILSEHAYPKRLSTLFPALDIVAAIAVSGIFAGLARNRPSIARIFANLALCTIFACHVAFTCYAWFSGRYWRFGEPVDIAVTAQIAELITPGTIVISDLNRNYEAGKYLYLLIDHLTNTRNRPNTWFMATTPMMPELIQDPMRAVTAASATLPYIWTKLRDQLYESSVTQKWSKVIFIFQVDATGNGFNADHLLLARARCQAPTIRAIEGTRSGVNRLEVIECPAESLGLIIGATSP